MTPLKRRIATAVAITIVIAVAAPALWFFTAIEGGVSGFVANRKSPPDPASVKITEARKGTVSQLNAAQDELLRSAPSLTKYSQSSFDRCSKGQHDWLRSDPYAYRCQYTLVYYLGFDSDFRQTLLEIETNLNAMRWKIPDGGHSLSISKLLHDYYDDPTNTLYGTAMPRSVSNLPEPGHYHLDTNSSRAVLRLNFFDRASSNLDRFDVIQRPESGDPEVTYERYSGDSAETIWSIVTREKPYVLVVSMSEEYFSN